MLVAEDRFGAKTTGWGSEFTKTKAALPFSQEETGLNSLKYVNPMEENRSSPPGGLFNRIRTTPTTRTTRRTQE
jgi:hypothetical protein